MKKIKEIFLASKGKQNKQIIKEKNSISYRLNNRLFLEIEPSKKIVKNIFYNYITIPPISNDTKKIIKKISYLSNEELKILLSKTLNSYFKEFIKQSRLSKASIETYYNELISDFHKQHQHFKANAKKEFTKKVSIIKKRIYEIYQIFDKQQEQITQIKNDLDKNENVIQKEQIANLEDKRREIDLVQKFLKEREKLIDKNAKPLELMNVELIAISDDVEKMIIERKSLIEELNQHSLNLSNHIDDEFTKKEKQIATIEIEKISAYIFIRNSLMFLNRIIRDVKIELGLRKVQNHWNDIINNFSEIKEQSEKMMNQFNFFDSITDIESKIDATSDIEINTRVVNFETSEELGD